MITISIPLFIVLIVFASITVLNLLVFILSFTMYMVDYVRVSKLVKRNTKGRDH